MTTGRTYGPRQIALAKLIIAGTPPISAKTLGCHQGTMQINAWYARLVQAPTKPGMVACYEPTEYSHRWAKAVLAGKPVPQLPREAPAPFEDPTPHEGVRTV